MSLFDLRDVCIVIGSLATLDVPMVVDLIGIYVLKGPYCTLTTTNWFLQALSVIPRDSWGDVARRFTLIRWAPRRQQGNALKHPMYVLLHYICYVLNFSGTNFETSAAPPGTGSGSATAPTVMYAGKLYTSLTLAVSLLELPLTLAHIIGDIKGTVHHNSTLMGHRRHIIGPLLDVRNSRPLLSQTPPPPCAAARLCRKFVSGQFDEENPFVLISSVLLVQADEGVLFLVVDRIGDIYRSLPRRADVIVTTVGARHKCQQGSGFEHPMNDDICIVDFFRIDRLPAFILCSSAASPGGGSGSPTVVSEPSFFGSDQYELPELYLMYQFQIGSSKFLEIPATPPPLAAAPFPSRRARMRVRQPCVAGSGAARRASVAHEAAENCRPSSRARCTLAAQLRCASRTIGARWTAAGREGCTLAAAAGRPLPLLGCAAWSSAAGRALSSDARR
ncbi:hypothetical protein F511_36001 [Dorcoceras hygrometricum]|uniref:Uncharacterized protein n=1 Tax=Dorcoceras hygrometricum TaxID=472368 RepID=A0A2Z7AP27_9LAMI|nr:hypothetical protein F511_36001 [Dorcoceras hygrometricum]